MARGQTPEEKKAYDKLRKKREAWYAKEKKTPIFCKALDSEVHLTSKGFKHLIRDGQGRLRSHDQRMLRLRLLTDSISVITNATKPDRPTSFPKMRDGRQVTVYQWGLMARAGFLGKPRYVVIQRIGENGQLHFWGIGLRRRAK